MKEAKEPKEKFMPLVEEMNALKQKFQENVKAGVMEYHKIPREQNPSDSLAKPWAKDGARHFDEFGFVLP